MSKLVRVSDETWERINAIALKDNIPMGEVIDAFSANDWETLETYKIYGNLVGLLKDTTTATWLRTASNLLAGEIKTLELKRRGFV